MLFTEATKLKSVEMIGLVLPSVAKSIIIPLPPTSVCIPPEPPPVVGF